MSPTPRPRPRLQVTTDTSIEAVLKRTLGGIDASRATVEQVRNALAAAGIKASTAWAEDWLRKVAELRKGSIE